VPLLPRPLVPLPFVPVSLLLPQEPSPVLLLLPLPRVR